MSKFHSYRRLVPEDVVWGLTGCSRGGCEETAIIWDESWGQLCADCAEDSMERYFVLDTNPRMAREQLPGWDDNVGGLTPEEDKQ